MDQSAPGRGKRCEKNCLSCRTRRTCIYPEKPGINYITISGFHISQAATQWGAPTAEQVGMVATHWNKGWIIKNSHIYNNGVFFYKTKYGFLWSSTSEIFDYPAAPSLYFSYLRYHDVYLIQNVQNKKHAFTVRCVND